MSAAPPDSAELAKVLGVSKEAVTTAVRGAAYLASKQGDDGGFHSETYGALRGGAGITALAAFAISRLPDAMRAEHQQCLAAALAFLVKGIDEQGCPRNPDRSVDYPTYAAALALAAGDRAGEHGLPKDARRRLVDYLLAMQISEARGFDAQSVHHGGWELTGDAAMRGVTTGTNVSITTYALVALAAEKSDAALAARRRGLAWLARAQNRGADGGFYFQSDRASDNNKAQWEDERHERPRSYGTATADGLAALLAAGAKADDAAVVAARDWLVRNDELRAVPGFEKAPEGIGWPAGLRFYYYAGLARVLHALPEDTRAKRRAALAEHLVTLQQPDGRWRNDAHHMREDDPLIATPLALVALSFVFA